jgi:energy-coupling factor transport system ATP-binding protein
MTFTYSVDGKNILTDIEIPLQHNSFIILTGIENQAFSLIGGIVAGLFPLSHDEQVPRLEELIRIFKGRLELKEGRLPGSTVYLGPDPEKHLLFSRVDEEVCARPSIHSNPESVLALFGLSKDFQERRISSLSGGEKMRLALAIAFSKEAECTVLHGVIPWLDRDGKQYLLHEIEAARDDDRAVLLLEQEIESLNTLADCILFFNGQSLNHAISAHEVRLGDEIKRVSHSVAARFDGTNSVDCAVEFRNVDFRYDEPDRQGFHLDKLSFQLKSLHMYGLIGDNGTGKSTIANLILRLLKPVRGEIFVYGRLLESMSRNDIMEKVCYMSQFPEQQIMLSSVQQYRQRMEKRGNTLSIELMDSYFDTSKDYPVSILSPLEMKMLALATSVSPGTRILILDEPTWGIDSNGLKTLLEFLNRTVKALTEPTLLIITHDYSLMRLLGAVVLQLNRDGLMAEKRNGGDDELQCRSNTW